MALKRFMKANPEACFTDKGELVRPTKKVS
jgi:hypothetical protein